MSGGVPAPPPAGTGKGVNILDEKRNAAPGGQPDTAQEYVIELSESEIAAIEADHTIQKSNPMFIFINGLFGCVFVRDKENKK